MKFEMIVLYRNIDFALTQSFTDRFQGIFGNITLNNGTILKVKYHFFKDSDDSYDLINKLVKEKLITTAAPLHVAFQEAASGRPNWDMTDEWAANRKNPILIRKGSDIRQDINTWPLPYGQHFKVLYIADSEKGSLTDTEKRCSPEAIKSIEGFVKNEFENFTKSVLNPEKDIDSLNEKVKQLEIKNKGLERQVKESDGIIQDALKGLKKTIKQNKELKLENKKLKAENKSPEAVAK